MKSQPLPRAANWIRSPTLDAHCLICGKPLGSEPHRVTACPNGVHERCRPWQRQPFTLESQLERLRTVARALASAHRDTVALGRRLRRLRDTWPPVRPGSAVRKVEKESARLRRVLDTLRDKLWV